MKYETFEATFIKENKQLRLILGAVTLLLVLILFFILTDKKYFVLKNSKLISERPLLTWVCEESFQSITKGKPEKELIVESILRELDKNQFKVSSEEILSVLSIKDNLCRIIVRGDGKTRSFLVNFKTDPEFPFHYKLSEINEVELNQNELSLTQGEK